MGYRVEYGGAGKYPEPVKKGRGNVFLLTGILFFLFLSYVNRFWPEGAEVLDRLMSFEQWAYTRSALETMADNLRHGLTISEAVTAFCQEIVHHGLEYAA